MKEGSKSQMPAIPENFIQTAQEFKRGMERAISLQIQAITQSEPLFEKFRKKLKLDDSITNETIKTEKLPLSIPLRLITWVLSYNQLERSCEDMLKLNTLISQWLKTKRTYENASLTVYINKFNQYLTELQNQFIKPHLGLPVPSHPPKPLNTSNPGVPFIRDRACSMGLIDPKDKHHPFSTPPIEKLLNQFIFSITEQAKTFVQPYMTGEHTFSALSHLHSSQKPLIQERFKNLMQVYRELTQLDMLSIDILNQWIATLRFSDTITEQDKDLNFCKDLLFYLKKTLHVLMQSKLSYQRLNTPNHLASISLDLKKIQTQFNNRFAQPTSSLTSKQKPTPFFKEKKGSNPPIVKTKGPRHTQDIIVLGVKQDSPDFKVAQILLEFYLEQKNFLKNLYLIPTDDPNPFILSEYRKKYMTFEEKIFELANTHPRKVGEIVKLLGLMQNIRTPLEQCLKDVSACFEQDTFNYACFVQHQDKFSAFLHQLEKLLPLGLEFIASYKTFNTHQKISDPIPWLKHKLVKETSIRLQVTSLDSLLIKPLQQIPRYPLFTEKLSDKFDHSALYQRIKAPLLQFSKACKQCLNISNQDMGEVDLIQHTRQTYARKPSLPSSLSKLKGSPSSKSAPHLPIYHSSGRLASQSYVTQSRRNVFSVVNNPSFKEDAQEPNSLMTSRSSPKKKLSKRLKRKKKKTKKIG